MGASVTLYLGGTVHSLWKRCDSKIICSSDSQYISVEYVRVVGNLRLPGVRVSGLQCCHDIGTVTK